MAELRLTGGPLAMARSLAENGLTRGLLWRIVSADFGVAELRGLPEDALGKVEEVPAPVQSKPPRTWGEGDLGVPSTERCSAARLRAAFADGSLSPVDVLEHLLQREADGDFGASTYSPFVALDQEGARKAAEASAARWSAGEAAGPLDGIPVPIKDEFHMRGLPTRGGTSWRNEIVDEDAVVIQRLRAGGAVLPGKAHATENGLSPLGYNAHFDFPRNVYSSGHAAGGSSTGSAVAVGLGLAPVAVSTDGGGSIRLPAAVNGLFGLKPTFNRLSGTGDIWMGTVGHTGPIGVAVSDLVDLLEVTAGRDPADPRTHFAPDWDTVVPTWRPALGRGIKGCRIGVLRDEFAEADPAISTACDAALQALARDGAELVDVSFPHLPVVNAVGPIVIAGESAANAAGDQVLHRHETGDELRLIYGLLKEVGAQLHLRGLRARTGFRLRAAAALADVDVLVCPTAARLAPPYPLSENRIDVADTAWTAAFTRFSFLANLTGIPAGTAPVGMHDGLPIGLQVMGDAWDEASVIAVLAHLERTGVTELPLPAGYRPVL